MKTEYTTIDDMLSVYLMSNFASRYTLVIAPLGWWATGVEIESIEKDLAELGVLPPKGYYLNGFWIIEMPAQTAFEIIRRHNKSPLTLRCFYGGEQIHEEPHDSPRKWFTWDDIYAAADGAAFGDDTLTAKDEARWQVRNFAMALGAPDLDECECPEDQVESYCDALDIRFDKKGNIANIHLPKELTDLLHYEGVSR